MLAGEAADQAIDALDVLGAAEQSACRRGGFPQAFGRLGVLLEGHQIGVRCTLFSPDGRVIATTHEQVPAPLARDTTERLPLHGFLPGPRPETYAVGIYESGKLVALPPAPPAAR